MQTAEQNRIGLTGAINAVSYLPLMLRTWRLRVATAAVTRGAHDNNLASNGGNDDDNVRHKQWGGNVGGQGQGWTREEW